jgi:hypothetical protein
MATIQGKYTLIAKVQAAGTLEDANRNVTFSVTAPADAALIPDCLNKPINAVGYSVINSQYDVTIKRIRLNANGAPGAKHAPNYYAGVFNLILGHKELDDSITEYATAEIKIPEWGEWYELNLKLCPYKYDLGPVNDYCGFYIDVDNNIFRIDCLNLDSAFEGLGVTPWLEMEIETAGVTASSNGIEY